MRSSITQNQNGEGNLQELKTVNKAKYAGFQMFHIFENTHLNELAEFLEVNNPKLFALLLLRQRGSQSAHNMLKELLPKV